MKVHWTARAKSRLKNIERFIAEEDPATAKSEIRRILIRSKKISTHPLAGRQVPEYQHNDIREVLERPYRIIYCIQNTQIDVLAVMHYRQLLPSDIKNL
ncbi:MAG: type II toxin-antitoxin system RelE/ParE family toxin [Gammaproteobacteria bacterium]